MARKIFDQVEQATAANATTQNVFSGRRFERAPFTGLMTWFATGSAAGLEAELNIGGRSVSPRVPLNTQNRQPVVPDDVLIAEVEVYEGELIQVTQVNTTAGSLTGRHKFELEEGVFVG